MSTENIKTIENKTAEKVRATARTAENTATKFAETAKAQFAQATEKQLKAADDVTAFNKSNVDALVQAGSIFFRGMEELTRTVVSLTQANVDSGVAAAKALVSAKNVTEFTELHNNYAKTAFDNAVSETTRLSELAIRVTHQTFEPINARVTAAVEQISKPLQAA